MKAPDPVDLLHPAPRTRLPALLRNLMGATKLMLSDCPLPAPHPGPASAVPSSSPHLPGSSATPGTPPRPDSRDHRVEPARTARTYRSGVRG